MGWDGPVRYSFWEQLRAAGESYLPAIDPPAVARVGQSIPPRTRSDTAVLWRTTCGSFVCVSPLRRVKARQSRLGILNRIGITPDAFLPPLEHRLSSAHASLCLSTRPPLTSTPAGDVIIRDPLQHVALTFIEQLSAGSIILLRSLPCA